MRPEAGGENRQQEQRGEEGMAEGEEEEKRGAAARKVGVVKESGEGEMVGEGMEEEVMEGGRR